MLDDFKRLCLLGCAFLAFGCGSGDRVTDLETVENLSEAVANRLVEFSDTVRRRAFADAADYLAADFAGQSLSGHPVADSEELALGTTRTTYGLSGAGELGRTDWLTGLERALEGLESIDRLFFKTKGAEFEQHGQRGSVRIAVTMIGERSGGKPFSLTGRAAGEVVLVEDGWRLRRFGLEQLGALERDRPIFTDVARSAGVAWRGGRLGSPGNDKFYWRGAATADIDGDGLYDVFTAAPERNFLYRNRGDGRFDDVTAAAGLERPAGATSPLFLDYDNDGDRDLFCCFVGWFDDGVPYGSSLRLFRNDGAGAFTDVSAGVGLADIYCSAFSAIAFDADDDGWLDVFVCCYERMDAVYPNSWYRADNGQPNLLLKNIGGTRFEDRAGASGVAGSAWSYAAAAADYDDDGDQDFYVANDYGDNSLYRNRGDGTFEDVASAAGVLDTGNGMGAAWGDLDNDGDLDLYVANMSSSAGNRILRRFASADGSAIEQTLFKLAAGNSIFVQDAGTFSRLPEQAGGIGASWAWAPALLDIDLDGLLDIYVANGFISGDSLKDT